MGRRGPVSKYDYEAIRKEWEDWDGRSFRAFCKEKGYRYQTVVSKVDHKRKFLAPDRIMRERVENVNNQLVAITADIQKLGDVLSLTITSAVEAIESEGVEWRSKGEAARAIVMATDRLLRLRELRSRRLGADSDDKSSPDQMTEAECDSLIKEFFPD